MTTSNSIEFLYAQALLQKLYTAGKITREVFERAESICRKKLAAA